MENKPQKKIIKFSEIKDRIRTAIDSKSLFLGITEPVSLIDGFINSPISMELSGSFVIGGPTIPMIMLVGTQTGRIYFFALKALIPDLEA